MTELGVAATPFNSEGPISRSSHSSDFEALRDLLDALTAMRDGDFAARLPAYENGLLGKISEVFNTIGSRNARIAQQLKKLGARSGRRVAPANA